MSAQPAGPDQPPGLANPGYELFIASVAVLSIINLLLLWFVHDPGLDAILLFMNFLCSGILLIDFSYRLRSADSPVEYFFVKFGWADLLSCLPLPSFKVLRLFQLVRVSRLLKRLGAKRLLSALLKNTAGSALLSLLFIGILVIEFGSLAMLHLESDNPDANITSASDAIWYMVVTMSTVGYGDQFPVSNPGRVLGAVVIVIGVGIFGTLTGYLANAFVSSRESAEGRSDADLGPDASSDELPAPQRRLAELRQLRAEHEATLARIERLISQESG